MYCYKKSDKNKTNHIEYCEAVRFKSLYNDANYLRKRLHKIFDKLTFQSEEEHTKKALYRCLDELNKFQDNLKLKDNISIKRL